MTDSSVCSFSRRLPIRMFRISCVFVKDLFWQFLVQVTTDLLIWSDAHRHSRATIHSVAVLSGKFVKSKFLAEPHPEEERCR